MEQQLHEHLCNVKIALQSLKFHKSILMTALKHCFQRKGLYILPDQLGFVQTLKLATFVALGDGYHFMDTVNHRANSDVKDSTEQLLFLYSIWQLHSHRLCELLKL